MDKSYRRIKSVMCKKILTNIDRDKKISKLTHLFCLGCSFVGLLFVVLC
jgi:hypothetical protein